MLSLIDTDELLRLYAELASGLQNVRGMESRLTQEQRLELQAGQSSWAVALRTVLAKADDESKTLDGIAQELIRRRAYPHLRI